MSRRIVRVGLGCLVAAAAGCGEGPSGGSGPPTLAVRSPVETPTPVASPQPAKSPEPPSAAPVETFDLALRLTPGMRFPLLKTVRQTLVQGAAAGGSDAPTAGWSELELLMGITVEEVTADGRMRLGIRYNRVRYLQDVAGRRFEFDSRKPAENLPAEATVYAGMAGDGFRLWIGKDNRIADMIDFDAFVERCLKNVPPEHRDRVTSRIAQTSGDESLANFIDDSIGLLPYRANHGATAAVGDVWRRERPFVRPIRLFLTEECTLAAVDDKAARIDVAGRISASKAFGPAELLATELQVAVRGGHSFGRCVVDRATGLPVESEVERLIDLRVRTPEGKEYDQTKRVVTVIRAFPRQ